MKCTNLLQILNENMNLLQLMLKILSVFCIVETDKEKNNNIRLNIRDHIQTKVVPSFSVPNYYTINER